VDFAKTTTYYWPNFDLNATEGDVNDEVEFAIKSPAGPFGFGSAVQLDDSQCLADKDFALGTDTCILNPRNCPNGLSVGFFYKMEYEVEGCSDNLGAGECIDPSSLETNFTKTFRRSYLLSTGGEAGEGGKQGSPGISIYREGPIMGATLSTGYQTWEVKVMGNLPKNNTWTNIAIRWEPLKFNDEATYSQALEDSGGDVSSLGGLQLFLNLDRVAQSLLPIELDCSCPRDPNTGGHSTSCSADEVVCPTTDTQTQDPKGLSPPTMMLGCHETRAELGLGTGKRGFAGGTFDEVAFWDRRIGDDEIHMFLGGYKASFDNVDVSELVGMMNSVDFSDPDQAATALQVLSQVVGGGEETTTPFSNIFPTTTLPTLGENGTGGGGEPGEGSTEAVATTTEGSTAKEEQEAEEFKGLVNIMLRLTNSGHLPANLTKEDFEKRIEVSRLVGDFMDPKGAHAQGWQMMNRDNDEAGAHALRLNLEQFGLKALLARILQPKESSVGAEVHSENSFVQYEKMAPAEVRKRQVLEGETFVFPMWRSRVKREAGSQYVVQPLEKWEHFSESVEVPLSLFSGECAEKDISFVGAIYEDFPDPGRKSPVTIWSHRIALDSRVVSINASANQWDKDRHTFGKVCVPDPKLLVRKRLLVNLATKSSEKSRRQLLFHADEEETTIMRRHCALWNPHIGLYGAWDTQGITTERIDETGATCVTSTLGTYAIIAEKIEPPVPYEEEAWLYTAKMAGYGISIVLLLVYILTIQVSAYLWEQFHIIRMNLAVAVLCGHAFTLLGELPSLQEDRHICTLVGCCISYFYTAAAALVAVEAHACFKAITGGIVGGRARVYLPTAWGLPAIALGFNVYQGLQHMGQDPKCMVGWENEVKWRFFAPVLAAASFAFLLMLIVLCNLATPAIRKSSILEEVGSVSNGMVGIVVYFTLTWAFAPLAYIRFPDLALPDFYPCFQVLNSCMGVIIFVLLGLASTRFRAVLAGTVMNRKSMIMETTVNGKK